MSFFEVHFGGFTHWCHAESPVRAALLAFRACLDQWHTFPRCPFLVINMEKSDEESEAVGLAVILAIQNVVNEELAPFPSEEAQLAAERQWLNNEMP